MFSRRTSRDRTENRLAAALASAPASGRLDLTVSNPTQAGLPYDRAAILEALADPAALTYAPEPFGLRSARETVSAVVPGKVPPDHILLTASTSEAYAYLFKLLCDPGDEVLLPAPSYPLFDHLAGLEDVRLCPYRLEYDGEWHVDLAYLRAAVTVRTKAILAVSPNNPTGSYLARDELAAMAGLGLPIISDEVFGSYPLRDDPRRATTALGAGTETLVFALGGLSKLAALPQLKLAWTCIAGPAARRDEAIARLELIADTFLSPSTPPQVGLRKLLAASGVTHAAIRTRTASNLAVVRRACEGTGVSVLDVEGGWYATLRVPRTSSEEEWVLALLEHDRVHVQPGWFFDFAEEAVLVISLLTPEPVFAEGVARILARMEAGA